MSADDSEIARLLDAARQADPPNAARLAAVRAHLLPPAAAGHVTPQPSTGFSAVATPGLLAAKIAVVVALALAGASAFMFRHAPDATSPSVQHEPIRSATQTVAPVPDAPPPASEAVEPAPQKTAAPTPPSTLRTAKRKPRAREPVTGQPTAASAVAEGSTLNAEASLLRLATLALRAGRLDEARNNLALFAQHYPNSQLNAERERLERRARELEATRPRAWTVKPVQ